MDLQKELETLGLADPYEVTQSVSNDDLYFVVIKEENEDHFKLEIGFKKVTESQIKEILKTLKDMIK
jgi:hypothetical protein